MDVKEETLVSTDETELARQMVISEADVDRTEQWEVIIIVDKLSGT